MTYMNRDFRETLRSVYITNPSVISDLQQYDSHMEKYASQDMLSYSLCRTCLLLSEEMAVLRNACSDGSIPKAIEACKQMEGILRNDHGLRPYHAVWAINCWMYALDAHICYFNAEYAKRIESLPTEELIPLANSGDAYASSTLYIRDMSKKEWLEKTDQYDHPIAKYYIAVNTRGDLADAAKNQQSLEICLEAVNRGYPNVCIELVQLYQGVPGIEKNAAEVYKYARMGADAGLPKCIMTVSDALLDGDGVEPDPIASFYYLEKLAASGDAEAQFMCGCAYRIGERGAVQDDVKSFNWMKQSADQGNSDAQLFAAKALLRGDGIPRNSTDALQYFKDSANQGNVEAMEEIARMYLMGEDIPKNEEEAASWYKKAADAGSGFACSMLASFYRGGIGVARNLARADQYEKKATELGYEDELNDEDANSGEDATDNIDYNDPSFQAKAREFASEFLAEEGIEESTEGNYVDDNWDLHNLGKGDGITEIRNPKAKELFRVMTDTWNAFASVVDNHNLDLYKDQGRHYMYMLSKLSVEFCKNSIPNFSYYLLNFLYSSSCRLYMGSSEDDYFNKEFLTCSKQIDDIQKENDLTTSMLIYLYFVNLNQGNYSSEDAKEVSAEQLKYTKQFLITIRDISQGKA